MNKVLEAVFKVVEAEFGVSRTQLLAPTRSSRDVAWARQVAMSLYHTQAETNYTQTGLLFGRDRSTVRHALEVTHDRLVDADKSRLIKNVGTAAAL